MTTFARKTTVRKMFTGGTDVGLDFKNGTITLGLDHRLGLAANWDQRFGAAFPRPAGLNPTAMTQRGTIDDRFALPQTYFRNSADPVSVQRQLMQRTNNSDQPFNITFQSAIQDGLDQMAKQEGLPVRKRKKKLDEVNLSDVRINPDVDYNAGLGRQQFTDGMNMVSKEEVANQFQLRNPPDRQMIRGGPNAYFETFPPGVYDASPFDLHARRRNMGYTVSDVNPKNGYIEMRAGNNLPVLDPYYYPGQYANKGEVPTAPAFASQSTVPGAQSVGATGFGGPSNPALPPFM